MRLEFTKVYRISKTRPVNAPIRTTWRVDGAWCLRGLLNHAAERIGGLRAVLTNIWQIKERICDERTAAKGRLRAELFEDQLLDRVVEDAEARANSCFVRTSGEFCQPTFRPSRTPRHSDPRSKGLIVGRGQTARDPFVSGENQSEWEHRVIGPAPLPAVAWRKPQARGVLHRQPARILSRNLARSKCLQPVTRIEIRCVEFPPQTVV